MARLWLFLASAALGACCGPGAIAAEVASTPEGDRYAALQSALDGATLVGHFTVTGQERPELRSERYELRSVKHLEEDQWLFQARIKYGEHDVVLPITLPIKWAGDTPVITADAIPLPGLGTYTARVMIYQDHYAGFWSGDKHGGHLFGTIERESTSATE